MWIVPNCCQNLGVYLFVEDHERVEGFESNFFLILNKEKLNQII